MMWWDHGFNWTGMIFGAVMMLLFWGGLITAAVIIIRAIVGAGSNRGSAAGGEDALDILKKRYARGDISKDEYEEMRRDLSV
jgi:putative membrane protein